MADLSGQSITYTLRYPDQATVYNDIDYASPTTFTAGQSFTVSGFNNQQVSSTATSFTTHDVAHDFYDTDVFYAFDISADAGFKFTSATLTQTGGGDAETVSFDDTHIYLKETGDHVTGETLEVDFTVSNSAAAQQGSFTYHGTSGDDTFNGGTGNDIIFLAGGNDTYVGVGGSDTVYGGQGDDVLNASASNDGVSNVYLSGDNGNDNINGGSGSDTLFGGQGDDQIIGGSNHASGTNTSIFGGMGNDIITFRSVGGATLYGGQGDDIINLSGGAANDTTNHHYVFGNIGNDSITNDDDGASIYGGQGNDTIRDTSTNGHAQLHGDLGDDSIRASPGGADTVFGGVGADTLVAGGHTLGDTFYYFTNDSTAPVVTTTTTTGGTSSSTSGSTESNLDHITGFQTAAGAGQDHIALQGHGALVVSATGATNLTTYVDTTTGSTDDATAFQAAYLYAYGDGTSSHVSHVATEYLAVQENVGGGAATFIFTQDHQAFALTGVTAGALVSNDIIAG